MSYQSWLDMKNRRAQQFLENLREMLAAENLQFVTVTYSGSGDNGQFHFASFKKIRGKKIYRYAEAEKKLSRKVDAKVFTSQFDTTTNAWVETFAVQKTTLSEWFIDAAHHAVGVWHSGWENNEGGCGTVRFDSVGITVSHSDYVISTEDYTHSWSLEELGKVPEDAG